jgi:hypothetical protein
MTELLFVEISVNLSFVIRDGSSGAQFENPWTLLYYTPFGGTLWATV